ncbi:MAG: Response regulator receiver protein [Conexibacter sp.]|nr:Response regulator receiver protein [Conexibacter sp.]
MTSHHHALIVEDDRPTARDLAEILATASCRSTIVDNKRDALALSRTESFCLVLLDLEIKLDPDGIKGHRAHGLSLLRDVRREHFEHAGAGLRYELPILVVSGFAREVSIVQEVMKDGADGVIHKPFNEREVLGEVENVFERIGRVSHERCVERAAERSAAQLAVETDEIVLAIPGTRERRRTRVLVGSRSIMVPNATLKVLLRLMVARSEARAGAGMVHKRELGASDDHGFKGVSVLREALKPALPDGINIIDNDWHGHYFLTDRVVIGSCDVDALTAIGDRDITDLAHALLRTSA